MRHGGDRNIRPRQEGSRVERGLADPARLRGHRGTRGCGVTGVVTFLWVVAGLIGCGSGGPEQGGGPTFVQVDSAGILISISSGGAVHAPLGWTVGAEPDLVLGRRDSPSGYFHRVQGMRTTEDGGVLVVDGGSQELRFHDAEGRLMKRAGGPREGPGEFRDPVLVPVVGMDSLLVFDTRLPRAQVLSAQGEYGRLIRFEQGRPFGARAPVGAVGFRHMLFDGSGTAGGPEIPAPDRGMVQYRQRFLWYDTATGHLLTSDSVLVDGRYYDRPLHWVVPFTARSSAATTEAGAFITRGRPAEILEHDVQGELRRIFRIEGWGRSVTQNMIDEMGWLWAEIYDFDPTRPREWVVFDPEGRARGTVRTPPGLEVQWIGHDALLGLWRDEFDVEHVHRHRLTRGATPGGSAESADDR